VKCKQSDLITEKFPKNVLIFVLQNICSIFF